MIPCLMERPIKDEEKTLCLMYKFNRNTSTIWIYNKLLKAFTKRFLGKHGGTFDLACSQKIGKRRLGTVREIRGTCMWTNRRDSIREPKQYSFLLNINRKVSKEVIFCYSTRLCTSGFFKKLQAIKCVRFDIIKEISK